MKTQSKCPNCNVKAKIISSQTGVAENGTPVVVMEVECPKCHAKGHITKVIENN